MKKFAILLMTFGSLVGGEAVSKINYSLVMDCFPSAERDALESAIPAPDYRSPSKEEWVCTTVNELERIIALLHTGKFENATVTFGSDNGWIDQKNLLSAKLSVQFFAAESEELEALRCAAKRDAGKGTDYATWSTKTIKDLQAFQRLIFKGKIASVKSESFRVEQGTSHLTEMKIVLDFQGPSSEEFQSLLAVLPEENKTFSTYSEWSLAIINALHKAEILILSGKINLGSCTIQEVSP